MTGIRETIKIYAQDRQAVIVPCSVGLAQAILDKTETELPIPYELYKGLHAEIRLYVYVPSPIRKLVCFCNAVRPERHDDSYIIKLPLAEKILRYDISLTKIKVAVPRKARILTIDEVISIETEDIRGDSQPIKAVYIPMDNLTETEREKRRALNRASQRRLRQRRGSKARVKKPKATEPMPKQAIKPIDDGLVWGG